MSAIAVQMIGGPYDGRLMSVPGTNGCPRDKTLTVLEPLDVTDYDDPDDDHVLGVQRCFYDLALSRTDTGPLYAYLYRDKATLY